MHCDLPLQNVITQYRAVTGKQGMYIRADSDHVLQQGLLSDLGALQFHSKGQMTQSTHYSQIVTPGVFRCVQAQNKERKVGNNKIQYWKECPVGESQVCSLVPVTKVVFKKADSWQIRIFQWVSQYSSFSQLPAAASPPPEAWLSLLTAAQKACALPLHFRWFVSRW